MSLTVRCNGCNLVGALAQDPLSPAAREDPARPSRRLLKTWQNVDLVRRMDEIIIASRGAYSDRSEFLAEALRDRIEAEEERLGEEAGNGSPWLAVPVEAEGVPPTPSTAANTSTNTITSTAPISLAADVAFGDWLGGEHPVLPAASGPATNFGLHNRDYPTLLAADWLGRLTAERREPLRWPEFTRAVTDWAWEFAEQLQKEDLDRPRGAKVAAGFPTNRKKRGATEARFREHFLGTIDKRRNQGPLFVFGLVGLDGERAALSESGVELLRALREAGVGEGPPFSPAAWEAFAAHLRAHAPEEFSTWRRVLAIVAEKPDRDSLVSRCDWWKGAAADTNSMSLIARGREWGLVELALDEGRYCLTETGQAELREPEFENTDEGVQV